jgi:hypothetical protein
MSTITKLLVRIVKLETQRCDHEHVHDLEERARKVAVDDMNRRLNDHNGLIQKMEDRDVRYVEKVWFEEQHKVVTDKIDVLNTALPQYISRREAMALVSVIAAVVGAIVSILTHFVLK